MSFLSRSDDSDSFVSSNYGSQGESERTPALDAVDDYGRTPGSPPLKKLRRSDYNAFASLVNSLKHTRPPRALNERRLARKSTTPSRTAQPDLPGSPLVELPPALRPAEGGIHPLFDVQTHVDHLLDDRWPLYTQALGPPVDFAESIGTAASKMVRLRGMSNPYLRNRSRTTDEALHEGDDVIVPLPEDLEESTRMYLDKLLAGLAILRPSLTRPKREKLASTGWEGVLQTAGLVKHRSSVARCANERVSKLFGKAAGTDQAPAAERLDISQVQQRLDMITSQRTKRKRPEIDEDAILAAVLKPKKPTKTQIRATETQDRIEARREKKIAKANKAIEKREIKQAKALRRDEAYREHIAEEKEQIEVKKRLARAEKKRMREEERAQKEARRRLRAERRERKRKRAEARAERAQSRGAVTPQGDWTDARAGKHRDDHGDTTQTTSTQARRQKKSAKSHNAQMADSTAAGVTPRAEGGEDHVPAVPAGSTRKTRRTALVPSSVGAAATPEDTQHERQDPSDETAPSLSATTQAKRTPKRKR